MCVPEKGEWNVIRIVLDFTRHWTLGVCYVIRICGVQGLNNIDTGNDIIFPGS